MRVSKICKLLGIARSTFYYSKQNIDRKEQKDKEVLDLLHRLPAAVLKWRGSKTKTEELRKEFGFVANHKRVDRICRKYGLLSANRRRKYPKDYYERRKEDIKNLPKNLLNRNFSSDEPLKKICTDVSYFRTTEGWLYLNSFMDLYNGKIVAYKISRHNDENLANESLDQLLQLGDMTGVLLHSDQGAIYTAKEYRDRLREKGIIQSMSRKGNCWDNARKERFFGTLKVESGYNDLLKTGLLSFKKTERLIDNFIDYYNNRRIQQKLGWKTPSEF